MTKMTCRDFDEIVHGVARLELLDVALREEAFEHARQCSACAERLSAAHALAGTATDYAETARNQQAPPRVEAVLLAAFRERHRRRRWLRVLEWSTAGVAAAGLALLLWTAWIGVLGPSFRAPEKSALSAPSSPARAVQSNSPETAKDSSAMAAKSTETQDQNDVAEEFVALPYAGSMGPGDSGMIVRVQLTPAALAQLGYTVAATPDQGMIRADVLIGEDGQPRAVRVVP